MKTKIRIPFDFIELLGIALLIGFMLLAGSVLAEIQQTETLVLKTLNK